MTHAEINRFLAENVMGWRLGIGTSGNHGWIQPNGEALPRSEWNPYDNIAQAIECAERDMFMVVSIERVNSKLWNVQVDTLEAAGGDEHRHLPTALSRAMASALKGDG